MKLDKNEDFLNLKALLYSLPKQIENKEDPGATLRELCYTGVYKEDEFSARYELFRLFFRVDPLFAGDFLAVIKKSYYVACITI